MMMTTTTKLYEGQVADYDPYYGTSFTDGEEACAKAIDEGRCAAWFSGITASKVDSLSEDFINHLHRMHPTWCIVVEADGAKEKWLKAPHADEPVIPSLTNVTVGVINIQVLGKELCHEYVHRLSLVKDMLGREEGAVITPSMLATLVRHPKGLFQHSRGKKVLFCTGFDRVQHRFVNAFLENLSDSFLHTVFLASGYEESCIIKQVISWR